MKKVEDMTLDECCVELFPGWGRPCSGCAKPWNKGGTHQMGAREHPYIPDLGMIAGAMPEGLRFERVNCPTMHRWEYNVWKQNPDKTGRSWAMALDGEHNPITVPDTGDEKLDRARLAVSCWRATKPSGGA